MTLAPPPPSPWGAAPAAPVRRRAGRRWLAGCLGVAVLALVAIAGLVVGYVAGARTASSTEHAMPQWRLPFAEGEIWRAGGPHSDGGDGGSVRNALDFTPSDGAPGRVLSVAAGKVIKIDCDKGFYLAIEHSGGWATAYYHLVNQQTALVGTTVPAGAYLGDVGTALPCGGRAEGPHVHLSLVKDDKPVAVEGIPFGGYRPFSSGKDYAGFWLDGEGDKVVSTDYYLHCCLTAEPATALPSAPDTPPEGPASPPGQGPGWAVPLTAATAPRVRTRRPTPVSPRHR